MAQITLNSTGVASNGSLVLQSNGTTTAVTVDTSQNVGVGVTPSAWGSGQIAMDIGLGSAIWNPGTATQTQVLNNSYFNNTNFLFKGTGSASRYRMTGAQHEWYSSTASGTAGNTISFTQAMTLDASGNLGIGTTSPSVQLQLQKTNFPEIRTTDGTNIFQVYSDTTNGGAVLGTVNNAALVLRTNATERMRIDSSGNLGIGTTSPAVKLDVAGVARTQNTADRDGVTIKRTNNANANGALNFTGSDDVVDAAIAMATDVADALTIRTAGSERARITSSGLLLVGKTSGLSTVDVIDTGTGGVRVTSGTTDLRLLCGASEAYLYNASNVPTVFSVNTTERMRIDTSGNLLVGTTSKLSGGINGFDVNSTTNTPGITFGTSGTSKAFQYLNVSGTQYRGETASGYTIAFVSGGTNGVSLANGGTSWGSLSDERKKDIIEPITDATNKVSTLRAVIGKYKTDDEGTRRSFLIAQDVQAVLPEAVVEDASGDLILQYSDTIPLLVAAIQEQQALITALTARITALESN